jgi:hypothetical protein
MNAMSFFSKNGYGIESCAIRGAGSKKAIVVEKKG